MTDLSKKVELYLGRKFDKFKEIIVQNDSDGKGSYIAEWNAVDKPQPTKEQLDAFDAQATILESNNQVDATRRKEYGSWSDQLDEIYHDIDSWKARLQIIKTNNQKS